MEFVNANVVLNSNLNVSGNLILSTGTGVLHSTNGVITSSNVVTSDLQNNSVTYVKMQTLVGSNVLLGGNLTGSTVTETKVYTDMIADGAITAGKLATGAATQFVEGGNIPSASNIDNYNLGAGSYFRVTGSTGSTISGFAGGTGGRYIIIINNLSTQTNITLSKENSSSTDFNRFVLPNNSLSLGQNSCATFIYVSGLTIGGLSNQSRWVLTSST